MNNKQSNIISRLMEENFKAMSSKTKENLFGASNAVFTEKSFKK